MDGEVAMSGTEERDTALVEASRRLLESGASNEDVLGLLRREGCEIITSIRILAAAAGMNTNDAKRIVHFSKSWADRRDANDRLHRAIDEVIDEETTKER